MKEFEEIPHSGGIVTFTEGSSRLEHKSPFPLSVYEVVVSLNGMVLCRGKFGMAPIPSPSVTIMMASDREGFFGYSCPQCKKYFRATQTPESMVCPYCLCRNYAIAFLTDNQKQYIRIYLEKSLEHFSTGQEISIKLDEVVSQLENNIVKLKTSEERQQLVVECKVCKLKTDILGIYASCPSCGKRNSLNQFNESIEKIEGQFKSNAITPSQALNDIVEAFSGFGSDIRYILNNIIPLGSSNKKIAKKIDFQKIIETNDILMKLYGFCFFENDEDTKKNLNLIFQKRHIISHNSGMVDQRYLDNTLDTSVRLGQRVSINEIELSRFISLIKQVSEGFFNQFSELIIDYLDKNKR